MRTSDDKRAARARRFAAWSRVFACVLAAVLIAGLGCRPRWSPDGKRLVYAAREGKQHIIAEHDFEQGRSRTLVELQTADGAADIIWDKSGNQWVVVSADGGDDNTVNIFTHDQTGKQKERHQIKVGGRNIGCLLQEPTIVDGNVFLTGNAIIRVDLKSGEATKHARSGIAAFPLGDDLGYVSKMGSHWSIGELDPKTLEATPWVEQPEGCEWQILPHPRFNDSRTRCAVVATQGLQAPRVGQRANKLSALKWAILILEQNELISTIELEGELSAGPIAWIDEVTICATVMRPGKVFDTFAMIETDFSGNVRRETAILKVPVDEKMVKNGGFAYALNMPFFMQPAPSPDGKIIAFTTAKLPRLSADRAGLLLLHRNKQRSVERLKFGSSDK